MTEGKLDVKLVDEYFNRWLNTEPVEEEPKYIIFGDIALYSQPYKTDGLVFLTSHLDCDALSLRRSEKHIGSDRNIVMFAINKAGNYVLDCIMRSEYGKYLGRLNCIDKMEVNSID